ncbi:MAG: FAD:protein FMN transferase [Desulfobacterales bacterium]|nr:MAG: FAD:protein FMN transferase [Desulfobacterales bacterium]
MLVLLPLVCEAKKEHLIQGRTMGTTYHLKIVTGYFQGIKGLKDKIEKRLGEINQSMSTYIKDSEISRFNDLGQADVKFEVTDDFFRVMQMGKKVYDLSEGAWDATVNPLVDLWGFGRAGRKNKIPPKRQVEALLPSIGFENIEIISPGYLIKKHASVTLDFSSIAKGYGVDAIAEVIHREGFQNYLVEIGGEVYASGLRKDGQPWRVGINRPQKDAAISNVYKVVRLQNKAFATSGDYRNFFEVNGIRYSHVIDPKTGYPVANGVVSVSIVSNTCTFADGLATAIMVMGHKNGLSLIDRLDDVEGLIVIEKPDGMLVDFYSKGFETEN